MELAFLSPSPMELMVIAVIALIVLGPTRLPDAARSVGKGMREMRNSFQGLTGDDDEDDRDDLDEDYAADDADLESLEGDEGTEDDDEGTQDDDSHAAPAAAPGRS